MADRVYLDTGDLLVTGRRVAFEGASLPLSSITSARVESAVETAGGERPLRRWEVVAGQLAILAVGGYALRRLSALPLSPGFLIAVAVATAVAAVVFPPVGRVSALIRGPRRTVRWHAVVLATGRRDVTLFRTRDPGDATAAVEAVTRALADRPTRAAVGG